MGSGFEPPTSPYIFYNFTNWSRVELVIEIQKVILLCRLHNGTKYSIGPRRANFAPNSDPKELQDCGDEYYSLGVSIQ